MIKLPSSPVAARRQHGNTLVGFIIGLVIGLGIAVVVALVITKGSTPFTDKSGKLGKLAEPTAGQISDPNKPLYGSKEAAREANKEFQKEPVPPDTGSLAQAVANAKGIIKPEPGADAKPTDAKSADTKAADAKSANPATAPDAAAKAGLPAAAAGKPDATDSTIYYLQAGAFHDGADAESTRAKLALLGFEASVSDRTSDNSVLHRVRLGPYTQIDAMNKVRAKLQDNGIDVAVVRALK